MNLWPFSFNWTQEDSFMLITVLLLIIVMIILILKVV